MNIIKLEFDKIMNQASEVFKLFPWENKMAYALWLNQTTHFVSYSTRLLSLTASRFDLTQNNLHHRFIEHCSEESGHERLSTKDIKNLGFNADDLKVFPSTNAFYQVQYYWIEHVHPVSFFGYLLFLEGLAVTQGAAVIERIVQAHGAKAATFLKVHASEDEDHLAKAFSLADQVHHSEANHIIENLKISSQLYFLFLSEISKSVKSLDRGFKAAV
jgi:hypothetical protein